MIQCMAQELLRVYKQARANVDEQLKVWKGAEPRQEAEDKRPVSTARGFPTSSPSFVEAAASML